MSDLSVRGYLDRGFGVHIKWDIPLLEGYHYVFLPVLGPRDDVSFWRPWIHGLWNQLNSGRFDALWVHGYSHQASLRAITVAKLLGIKVLMRGDAHLKSASRSSTKLWMKAKILPPLFRIVDGFLAIGQWNYDYYRTYGVPSEKLFFMPFAVDNDFFQKAAAVARRRREELRTEEGLNPGRAIILYASKLTPGKRPGDLLEAYVRLSPDGIREPEPYLLFVGDGEERDRLETKVKALGWSSVRFLGFKNQTELPGYYDLCDVFVLPSEYEPWGLVVNELMNAGKPVIVSDQVGCGPDLVQDGINGFIVPVGDVEGLADRLRTLTSSIHLAIQMGEASRRHIARWSFREDTIGLLQALECVLGGRHES